MKDILNKLQELIGLLEQKISLTDRVSVENENRADKLNEQDADLVARANALNARELAIRPIENILELKDKAIVEKAEADALLHSVRKEKDEFNKYLSAERSKLAEEKRLIGIAKDKADNEAAMIVKEWTAVRKEKAEYKDSILKELKAKIG